MITFFSKQSPFNVSNTANVIFTFDTSKEDVFELNKVEYINNEEIRSLQADVNRRVQRVQENYFLERRSFL